MKKIENIIQEFEGMCDTYLDRHGISSLAQVHIKANLASWLRITLEDERKEKPPEDGI